MVIAIVVIIFDSSDFFGVSIVVISFLQNMNDDCDYDNGIKQKK